MSELNEIKNQCEHEWMPNGIIKREVYVRDGWSINPRKKYGEKVFASCVCKKCGEIKIKAEY